jgi:hypothetical protein
LPTFQFGLETGREPFFSPMGTALIARTDPAKWERGLRKDHAPLSKKLAPYRTVLLLAPVAGGWSAALFDEPEFVRKRIEFDPYGLDLAEQIIEVRACNKLTPDHLDSIELYSLYKGSAVQVLGVTL